MANKLETMLSLLRKSGVHVSRTTAEVPKLTPIPPGAPNAVGRRYTELMRLAKQGKWPNARLQDDGYHIDLPLWVGYGDAALQLLRHEMSHLWRGDCIMRQTKDIQTARANIAQDAMIHLHFSPEEIASMESVMGGEGTAITVPRLQYTYPQAGIPDMPHGWKRLYDLLPDMKSDNGDEDSDGEVSEEARRKHAETIMKLAKEGLVRGILHNSKVTSWSLVKPNPILRHVSQLLNNIYAVSDMGYKTDVRSYSRPGRLSFLRGHVRQARLKVVLMLDVSGSMQNYTDYTLSAARVLSKECELYFILYSDTVLYCGKNVPLAVEGIGGGTTITPASERCNSLSPSVAVIYSDAQHESAPVYPSAPTIWILPPVHTKPMVRKIDRIILEK